MSNRLIVEYYTATETDRQALSTKKNKSRITGTPVQVGNDLRLSDIAKLIYGEHGGPCHDPDLARRYFFAALPHVVSSQRSLIAAKGCAHEAVRAWVIQWVPIYYITEGSAWIDEQTDVCLAKRRKTPRIDKLAKLLRVTEDQVADYGLRTIPATTRPKKVRKAERAAKSAERSRKLRALAEDYTPRSQSKAAQLRAAGINRNTHYSRERRARQKAEMEAMHTVSNAPVVVAEKAADGAVHTVSNATLSVGGCTQFRTQHHYKPQSHLPTVAEQAATMAALKARQNEALRQWMECDPVFGAPYLFEEDRTLGVAA